MNAFDDNIRTAAQTDPHGTDLATAGDEGLFGQMAATFRGRMRRWIMLIWLVTAGWFAVAVWAAVSFFQAETTRNWVLYAALFLLGFMAVSMLKIWYWMEMNRHTHTREIKRVELQLARLAEKIER